MAPSDVPQASASVEAPNDLPEYGSERQAVIRQLRQFDDLARIADLMINQTSCV